MDEKFLTSVDIDLLKKFDKQGPRYTSYPIAPNFSPSYTHKQFEVDLIRNNDDNHSPLSLYVHIPFCDTLCYFCGCTTLITARREVIKSYLETLKNEIALLSAYINKRRRVVQIHWGGGTPSYLTPDEINDLAAFIANRFPMDSAVEFSVEIDPRGLSLNHLEAFKNQGVNRISLGVQDFNRKVQLAVHRIQPEELTIRAVEWARTLGIKSINLDLMYGLPHQTLESFLQTLEKVVEISPDRIAVFNFAYVPKIKPHQKLIHPEDLPSPDEKLQILKGTIERLARAGYAYVGMDHFAKPTDELAVAQKNKTLRRNFQGYSTLAGVDLFGLGLSSISHFDNVYAQNVKTLNEYHAMLDGRHFATHIGYRMNRDDEIRKYVIMELMCNLEVSKSETQKRFGIVFDEYFSQALIQLEEFEQLQLVRNGTEGIFVLGAGRLLLRNIAMCFDAYLPALQQNRAVFSRTV